MGELPGRNVAKTGKGKNWKSRGRGKEKNMVVEYIPLPRMPVTCTIEVRIEL